MIATVVGLTLRSFPMLQPESTLPLAFQFTSPGSLLIHLGPLQIHWYGLLIASAVLLGTNLSQALAKRRGIKPELLSEHVIGVRVASDVVGELYYQRWGGANEANREIRVLA